jgi:hypothetical protein
VRAVASSRDDGDGVSGSAIRLRLRVGPRSPLHRVLAALPPEEQARALLRLAEVGALRQDGGARSVPEGPPAPGGMAAVMEPAIAAALVRIADAVERLADSGMAWPGRQGPASAGDGEARAAALDAAWDG